MSVHMQKWAVVFLISGALLNNMATGFAADATAPNVAAPPVTQRSAGDTVSNPPTVTAPSPAVPATTPTVVTESLPQVRPMLRRESLGEYSLVWCDEFNGDKLDAKQWECRTDTKYWSIGKEANVTESGGYAHIALKKEKSGKLEYTAGGIVSRRAFGYGYYEASIKCPAGKGWHTTFALTPYKSEMTGAKQEIDVLETDSIEPRSVAISLQQWKPTHRVFDSKKGIKTSDMSQDFHVFGCEFTPQKARYFIDGEQIASFDARGMVHDDQSIWIYCFAAPLQRTLHVEDDKLPGEVTIDWVRFYEKAKQ